MFETGHSVLVTLLGLFGAPPLRYAPDPTDITMLQPAIQVFLGIFAESQGQQIAPLRHWPHGFSVVGEGCCQWCGFKVRKISHLVLGHLILKCRGLPALS